MKILRGSTHEGGRHDVAILFSERSREQLSREAVATGSVYEFTNARGQVRRWLKGQFAYLAPIAQSAMLNRCNVKHDVVTETALLDDLGAYRTVFLASAGALAPETVAALRNWLLAPSHRLIVSGRTNLPDETLGLVALGPASPQGYSGWRWAADSLFGDRHAWDEYLVTGAAEYQVQRVAAAPRSSVLAELWDFGENATGPGGPSARRIGDGIVRSDRTLYIANEPFELLGGAMQAHVNVEAIRSWHDVVHWADRIVYFLWEILRSWNPSLEALRLRTFGSHGGALSIRHDVDKSDDLSMLEFEASNLVPATYHVLDPVISGDSTTREQAETWIRETAAYQFIETGLHNDSGRLEYIVGAGLYDHVRASEARLGIAVTNCGRHSQFHAHPETLDAMDYLYENSGHTLGMCSFSFFGMIEYGHPGPAGVIDEKLTTYVTDASRTIATSGFWFPFHPVVTTVEEYRVLRGWDITHEYDADYNLIEAIYSDVHARSPRRRPAAEPRTPPWEFAERPATIPREPGHLENGVYTIQYHPLFARDPTLNGGRGTLPYLMYAVAAAERHNFWIANKSMLHRRLRDYEDIRFRVTGIGRFEVFNPTDRRIQGLMVETQHPAWALWDGNRLHVSVVDQRYLLVPPLEPGASLGLDLVTSRPTCPLVPQPESRGLVIIDAWHDPATLATTIELNVTGRQALLIANLEPGMEYLVSAAGEGGDGVRRIKAGQEGCAVLDVVGPQERATRRSVEICIALSGRPNS